MVLYQTSESHLSVKQSDVPMIFCGSAWSSGSRCCSAWAVAGRAQYPATATKTIVAGHGMLRQAPSRLTYVEYSLSDPPPEFPSIRSRDGDDIPVSPRPDPAPR